jgi:hypothetical protein
VSAFHTLILPLITHPAAVSDGRKLSYTDATTGTVQALYLPALWIPLNRGLQELTQGHGDILIRLADVYYGRSPDGTYSTQLDAFQAVTCVDNPPITDRNVARKADAEFRAAAPFLDDGQPPSPALDNCAFWPVPPTSRPHQPQTPGLPTVMVISTTHDPATPYQAGVNLAHELNGPSLPSKALNTPPFCTASTAWTAPESPTSPLCNHHPKNPVVKQRLRAPRAELLP